MPPSRSSLFPSRVPVRVSRGRSLTAERVGGWVRADSGARLSEADLAALAALRGGFSKCVVWSCSYASLWVDYGSICHTGVPAHLVPHCRFRLWVWPYGGHYFVTTTSCGGLGTWLPRDSWFRAPIVPSSVGGSTVTVRSLFSVGGSTVTVRSLFWREIQISWIVAYL
jgi:hypothetical protein